MTKNILILSILLFAFVFGGIAEETCPFCTPEDYQAIEQLEGLNELSTASKSYIDLYIYNATLVHPKAFESSVRAPRNTFQWYMLREFETAEGFKKLDLFKTITK